MGEVHIVPPAIAERLGLAIRLHDVVYLAGGHGEGVDVTEPLLVDCNGRRLISNPRHPDGWGYTLRPRR